MKKSLIFWTVVFILILSLSGCDSFRTPTRPIYSMPFPMAIGSIWEYANESTVNYFLEVVDSVTFNDVLAVYIRRFDNSPAPTYKYFFLVWDKAGQSLSQYDVNGKPVFCLKYHKKNDEVVFGKYRSVLIDNNCLPYMSKYGHTHLNCRFHNLIEIATGDTLQIITDPQIGFFWRFDCGELIDWRMK